MGAKATTSLSRQKSSDLVAGYLLGYTTTLRNELLGQSPWYVKPIIESYSLRWSSIFASNRCQHELTTSAGVAVTVEYNEVLLFIRQRCIAAVTYLLPIISLWLSITLPLIIAIYCIVYDRWSYLFIAPLLNIIAAYVPAKLSSFAWLRFALVYLLANILTAVVTMMAPHNVMILQVTTIVARGMLTNCNIRYWWSVLTSSKGGFNTVHALICFISWEGGVSIDILSKLINNNASNISMIGILVTCMVLVLLLWTPHESHTYHTIVDEFLPRANTNLMLAVKRVISVSLSNYHVLTLLNIHLMAVLIIHWFKIGGNLVMIGTFSFSYLNALYIIAIASIIIMLIIYRIRPSLLSSPPPHYQRCGVPIEDAANEAPRFARLMDLILRSSRIKP
jgi:hypothetical protein